MKLPLASNSVSLQVANQVNQTGERLSGVFERLSSGLRINDASDDAAGLALGNNMRADEKVYEQGVRNLNDGISLASIADAALGELNNILSRQKELAEQAANGTLTFSERNALDTEFNALVDEFNRIVETTEYNGQNFLEDPSFGVSLQAGYGQLGSISGDLNQFLSTSVGDLTFSSSASISAGTSTAALAGVTADFDGDGILDIAYITGNGISIDGGNGDGTFSAISSLALATSTAFSDSMDTGDVDGDGDIDIVLQYLDDGTGNEETSVLINNGSGVFTETALTSSVGGGGVYVADVNNDGVDDIVELTDGNSYIWNGASFTSTASGVTTSISQDPGYVGDFDRDGIDDLLLVNGASQTVLYLGNGDGTFQSGSTIGTLGSDEPVVADFDGDGYLDIAGISGTTVTIYTGDGDGTFTGDITFTATAGALEAAADVNSDGAADLVIVDGATSAFFIGNRDGGFTQQDGDTLDVVDNPTFADFNGDGALDFFYYDTGSASYEVYVSGTESSNLIAYQDLNTQEGAQAAINATEANMLRVEGELGYVGGFQSRLESAVGALQVKVENLRAAGSAIFDTDIASDTAELVRLQVLQDSGTAVLAQANLQPEIVLSLLAD